MTTVKNFFSLLLLVAIATIFNTTSVSAQAAGDPAIVFNAGDMDQWNANRIPTTLPNGQVVLATNKTDKMQVIAVVRSGKIAQMGTKLPGGKFKVLQPVAGAGCSTIHCLSYQISHCYIIGSACVCVCGAWITSYPNP